MKITVEFDNEAEFEAFKTSGKKTRVKKADGTDDEGAQAGGNAPPPLMPPQGQQPGFGQPATGFAPQGQGAGMSGGFPAAGAPIGTDPAVGALVQRIATRVDALIAGIPAQNVQPQQPGPMLDWFKSQLAPVDPGVAGYTLDQIKQVALPRCTVPMLEQMAKFIAA